MASTMIELKAGAGMLTASAALVLCAVPSQVAAAGDTHAPAASVEITDSHASFGGPSSVASQIQSDEKPKASLFDSDETAITLRPYDAFKDRMQKDFGLAFGIDYNMLFQYASQSLGEDDAAGGVLRFFGSWTVLGQESANPGSRTIFT